MTVRKKPVSKWTDPKNIARGLYALVFLLGFHACWFLIQMIIMMNR